MDPAEQQGMGKPRLEDLWEMSWAEHLSGCRSGWLLAIESALDASLGTARSSAAALPPASCKSHCGSKDSSVRGGTARWLAHTCMSRKADVPS